MKLMLIFCAVALFITSYGCSCVSTVERANLISADIRENYVKRHPGGIYNDCIVNGEIMRGMSVDEVIASWGFPNVYFVTKTAPAEQWIYYIKDSNSLSMLIYTLSFADDTLQLWDVDQKRFAGQGIVSAKESVWETPVSTTRDPRKR